jgi:hypothetical protein
MKYAVEMGSGAMIHIPNFIKIGSANSFIVNVGRHVKNNLKSLERNYVRKWSGCPPPFWKMPWRHLLLQQKLGSKEIIRKNIPSLPLNGYFMKLYNL